MGFFKMGVRESLKLGLDDLNPLIDFPLIALKCDAKIDGRAEVND